MNDTDAEPPRRTCKFHADMMAALVRPETMGPSLKAIYERFRREGEQECIAHETQVVFLFQEAMRQDLANGWDPAKPGTAEPARK